MACVEVGSSSSTGDLLLHPARDPKLAPCPAWNVKMYCRFFQDLWIFMENPMENPPELPP